MTFCSRDLVDTTQGSLLIISAVSSVEQSQRDWLVEQRYRAVLEVVGGSRVSEVALRYGVSRQAVYAWKAKHDADGVDGLREASRRPKTSPTRVPAEVEALVCEMRRVHPRWGARRIAFELGRPGVAGAVAGHGAPDPGPQRPGRGAGAAAPRASTSGGSGRRRCTCGSWTWSAGSTWPTARECKLLTGIDDHSRFVVIATVLAVPTGRAVCDAFTAAMRVLRRAVRGAHRQRQAVHRPVHQAPPGRGAVRADLPGERHHRPADQAAAHRPRPGRSNAGTRHCAGNCWTTPARSPTCRRRRPRSTAGCTPTTTQRPHQALDMATPASLFRPNADAEPDPRRGRDPAAALAARRRQPTPRRRAAAVRRPAARVSAAVEFDTVIAASGLLSVLPRAQRIRIGPGPRRPARARLGRREQRPRHSSTANWSRPCRRT